jgi:hypothetical protein
MFLAFNDKTGDLKYLETSRQNFKGMEDVRKKYGDEVCHELRRVTIDLVEVNGSGRYPVPLPWLMDSGREATPAELMKTMEER